MSLPAAVTDAISALENAAIFGASEAGSDGVYLKMSQEGVWTYGSDATLIENGALWGVNPASIVAGYSCFDDSGRRLGEELRSASMPPIQLDELPKYDHPWKKMLGFQVVCLNGEDEGLQGMIHVRSKGGMTAALKLFKDMRDQAASGTDEIMPVIELKSKSYENKKFRRTIFEPIFHVDKWLVNDPKALEAQADDSSEEPAVAEPVRRRRRS